MPHLTPAQLYFSDSALHGRGVFAGRDYASGEIIEVCPVIVIPANEREFLDQTALYNHYYEWDGDAGLALGYGSLYNHSSPPNALYQQDIELISLRVVALTAIQADDEVTVNYNGDPDDPSPPWFVDRT